MIELVLESNDKDKVVYKYVPVGYGDNFGLVQLDKRDGTITILQEDKNKLKASLRHAVLTVYSNFAGAEHP